MDLVSISLVLLAFLMILLLGGVWIAIALLATGWVGMQFVAGNIPPARCSPPSSGAAPPHGSCGAAALHLDG